MARLLGLGVGAEAFRAALRVPNLLQNLLGEGVLSASFVPVHSQLLAQGRARDAGRLAGAVAGLLLVVVSVVVVAAVLFAEQLTRVLAWGFVPGSERFDLTVTLVRIVTPGVGLLVMSAWCLAILNSHRRFFLSYVAPVVWNAAIVASLVAASVMLLTESHVAMAMAIGALAGSALQLAIQLPTVLRISKLDSLSFLGDVVGMRSVVRKFGHVLAGRGGLQIAAYVDLLAASLLAAGAVAALGYAQTLYLLPVALFGMSVAASELPSLSTINQQDRLGVARRVDAALGRIAFFVLPTTVVLVIAGDMVVAALFGGGRFAPEATVQVGLVLAVYALGLPAATSSRVLQSVLYAAGNARTPALISLLRVAVAAAVGIGLMLPLDAFQVGIDGLAQARDPSFAIATTAERTSLDNLVRLGAVGLAAGSAFASWLELFLLRRHVHRQIGQVLLLGPRRSALLGAAACTAGAALALRYLDTIVDISSRVHGIAMLAVLAALYLAITARLKLDEADELLGYLSLRRRR